MALSRFYTMTFSARSVFPDGDMRWSLGSDNVDSGANLGNLRCTFGSVTLHK